MKTELVDLSHTSKNDNDCTYDHNCVLGVKTTYDDGNISRKKEQGYVVQGKDCIYLNAPKIYPSKDTPLLTEAPDIVGAINELFQSGAGGGDAEGAIIKPWVRPSDWCELPVPEENQVIFLVTTAYNTSPYCSVSTRPLDKYAFPENNGAYPAGLTIDIDWGDGHISHGVYRSSNQLDWTNPFGRNGPDANNTETLSEAGNYYYDYTGSENDGSAQKFWNPGGTVLDDGSTVFVVTVTVSDPQNVVIGFPVNSYALEAHIGKNINIDKCDINQQQAYLQHVRAFGWQPGSNKDKEYSYSSGGVVYWNTNGIFGGTRALRKIDATEPFTEIPDYMFKNCFYIPEMDLSEVTKIGEQAFNRCFASGMYNFDLPKCREIKKQAFSEIYSFNCKIIAPVLEILGEEAFYCCYAIREINLPKVIEIPKKCFYNCPFLQKIDAPEVKKIKDEALRTNYTLIYVNAPKLSYLGTYNFYDAYNLREAIFPMLSYAGDYSFCGCIALEKLVCSENADLSKTDLRNSILWYDNPKLTGQRPTDIT